MAEISSFAPPALRITAPPQVPLDPATVMALIESARKLQADYKLLAAQHAALNDYCGMLETELAQFRQMF